MRLTLIEIKKILRAAIFALICMSLFTGCGESDRNSQGVSYTFFGWFADSTGTLGLSTLAAPTSFDGASETEGEETPTVSANFGVVAFAGLQNNLANEAIRNQRMDFEYSVPGSSFSIPNTSASLNTFIGPSSNIDDNPITGETGDTTASLPDAISGGADAGTAGIANIVYSGVQVVSPTILQFLSLNRSQFPEPPYVLIVTSRAVGVGTSGREFVSNPVQIDVTISPDVIF